MHALTTTRRISLVAALLLLDLTPSAAGASNAQVGMPTADLPTDPRSDDRAAWNILPVVPPALAPGGELAANSCASSGTACVAVGSAIDRSGAQVVLAEKWDGARWTIQSTPDLERATSSRLQGVSCSRASDCTAVGFVVRRGGAQTALVERWDGARWSIQDIAELANSGLSAVACTAPNACTAVGSVKTATAEVSLAERWDGASWTVQRPAEAPLARSSALTSVSCTSSSACTAVGHFVDGTGAQVALAERWNGVSWILQLAANPVGATGATLAGVSCGSTVACTAVGFFSGDGIKQAGLAEQWDGLAWTVQPTPGSAGGRLDAVSCTSSNACTAVGTLGFVGTLAERWDGTAWALQATANPAGGFSGELTSVSCTTGFSCSAVGSFSNSANFQVTLAERQRGTTWSIDRTPNPTGSTRSALSDVSCVTVNACTAVGQALKDDSTYVSLVERWDGRAWSVQATPNPTDSVDSNLTGVSCATANSCMAVGSFANSAGHVALLVERWEGSTWTIVAAPTPSGNPYNVLSSVSCATSAACTAVGLYANGDGIGFTPLAERWDGAAWVIQPASNPTGSIASGLFGVSCSTSQACMAVGLQQTFSDQSTLAESWDGSAWIIQPTPNPAGATGGSELGKLSCTSPTACMAVGDYGPSPAAHPGLSLVEHWDGNTWTLLPTPDPSPPGANESPLFGVSCSSATACTAVGEYAAASGILLTLADIWNGQTWTIQRTPNPAGATNAMLAGVSCTSTSICIAVGQASLTIGPTSEPLAERSFGLGHAGDK